jgi:hypothetical protein
MMVDPFQLEGLALRLVEIGTRLQAAALIIAERVGTPTLDELMETTERTAREAMHALDHFRTEIYGKRNIPWPWP